MAQILKGAPVVAAMNEANAARCAALKEKGIVPTLAVVRVGAREDDISYEKGIVTRCGKVGVEVRQFHLAEDVTQEELLDVIRQINGDASVHGCLIFRPLPKRFDDRRVQEALAPEKDVDGITDGSMAGVFTNMPIGYPPCTAQACLEILKYYNVPLSGKRAVVVGRSLVVGKPLAMLLLGLAMGWGGLSVHCQLAASLHPYHLMDRGFFAGRALHALLAGVLSVLLFRIVPLPAGVFSPMTDASGVIGNPSAVTSLALLVMCAMLLLTGARSRKIGTGKES